MENFLVDNELNEVHPMAANEFGDVPRQVIVDGATVFLERGGDVNCLPYGRWTRLGLSHLRSGVFF